ncbi:MAG: SDR family NAD(P)-dependent oxidoreductase [Bacteroidota bacterium]
MKTTGNTVFISGGSAGIGLAIAKKLSEAGNKIIINGRNEDRLQKALEELENAVAIKGDLSVTEDRIRIANELKEQHPDVNIIINNAGAAFLYLLNETKDSHLKAAEEMNTNYLSVIHFTELLTPHLLQKTEAAVVNISSIAVFGGHKVLSTYSASKAALHSYTKSFRETYLEHENFQVYEVYPPLVNTEFSAGIGGAEGIPASEVADELFLALEKNDFNVLVGDSKNFAALV